MLQRAGYRCLQTSYNRGYKNKIYQNLKDLMVKPEHPLWLYDDALLIMEMINIKFKPTPRGQSIGADKRGECATDDVVDCLAGAAFYGLRAAFASTTRIKYSLHRPKIDKGFYLKNTETKKR